MNDFTRNGICNNMDVSPYMVELDKVCYYFSSKTYMDKFIKGYRFNREEMKDNLYKKYHFKLDANHIYDICFYEKVEKRGYRIEYGSTRLCRNTIKYVGVIKTSGT